jgi:hypothetical protein
MLFEPTRMTEKDWMVFADECGNFTEEQIARALAVLISILEEKIQLRKAGEQK